MSDQPPCPNWVDSQCTLPNRHEGPCYNDDDDIIWREPTTVERQVIAAEAAK